jgi:hypothetical protein
LALAASTFHCSIPTLTEEIGKIRVTMNGHTPSLPIDAIFAKLSQDERDAFVLRHLHAVWRSLERVTA